LDSAAFYSAEVLRSSFVLRECGRGEGAGVLYRQQVVSQDLTKTYRTRHK
jgi:hypothetical protein